jgi:glycosyltransferase 2 family protein
LLGRLARVVLKWVVPLLLVGWLVFSGKLDFRALVRVFSDPALLALDIVFWALGSIVIAGVRWKLLLRGLGFELGLFRAMHYQCIALFMNTAVPGNVAGDVYKNILAARHIEGLTLTRTLTCVMVERVLGLGALLVLSGVAVSLKFSVIYARAPALVAFVYLLNAGLVAGVAVALIAARYTARRKSAQSTGPVTEAAAPTGVVGKVRARAAEVGEALLAYASRPLTFAAAFGLSALMHGLFIALFFVLARNVMALSLSPIEVGVIYPLGMLTGILPLAPGGIGVGHAAFASLFQLFGAARGADAFNVFLLGQLAPNLLGVVPYLADGGRRET